MATPEDFIDTFYDSICDLHSVRKSLDTEYSAGLIKILQRAAKDISKHTGKFLHQLQEKKPDEDTLQTMISASPSSLNYKNNKAQLPIQLAIYNHHTIPYIPLLAKEGVKHKVGGEGKRGGLLVIDPVNKDGFHTLQLLVNLKYNDNPLRDQYDKACLDAMKELTEANLLIKDDIKNHHLLYHACRSQGSTRFDFLCDWCPEGMKDYQYKNLPIIHALIKYGPIEAFAIFLKAATKHHEKEVGLLFQTDSDGITACERAFDEYGKKEIMQIIGNCISFDDPRIPILHHVVKHSPKLLNDFSIRYTSAAYLKDSDGCNLDQAMLASGNKTFENDGIYFLRALSDDQVREIDPATDLYPCMVAASGETSDLSAVYVLLRRNPSLVRGDKIGRKRRSKRRIGAKRSRHK